MKLPGQINNPGCVYITTNKNKTALYIGVTSSLIQRISEHKCKKYPNSFSAKYNLDRLVYFNWFDTFSGAIAEEKRLKGGSRQKKIELINSFNPEWEDLYEKLLNE
jgi:putative endonuclease